MGQYTDIDDVLKRTVKLIFELRTVKKWSQEYTAGELGINQNTYSKWETGQTELTLRKLVRVCDLHGIEPRVFLGNVFGDPLTAERIEVKVVEDSATMIEQLKMEIRTALVEIVSGLQDELALKRVSENGPCRRLPAARGGR